MCCTICRFSLYRVLWHCYLSGLCGIYRIKDANKCSKTTIIVVFMQESNWEILGVSFKMFRVTCISNITSDCRKKYIGYSLGYSDLEG